MRIVPRRWGNSPIGPITGAVLAGLERVISACHSDLAMTDCQAAEEMGIVFLLALEEVRAARQELAFAVTPGAISGAGAHLARVETCKRHAAERLMAK